MELIFARSATRHRITRIESERIILRAKGAYALDADATSDPAKGERLLFVGDGESGVALEVIAAVLDVERLLVIHAMPLRNKYREFYEEEMKWRSM